MIIFASQYQNDHFFLAFTILFSFFISSIVCPQNLDDEERIRLDEQTIGIIDTTQVQLEPRIRFNSPFKPSVHRAFGVYAKERLWNLPSIYTPQKIDRQTLEINKSHSVLVTASPSIPISPFFTALLAGSAYDKVNGYMEFNYQDLDDLKKSNQGTEVALKAGLNLTYRSLSEIALSAQMSMRDLPWPLATSGITTQESPTSNTNSSNVSDQLANIYNLQLFTSNWNLHHWLSDKTQFTSNGQLEVFGAKPSVSTLNDEVTDLQANFNIRSHFLNLANPIHFGINSQYLSIAENLSTGQSNQNWSTLLELYAKDQFTQIGPFVFGLSVGVVSFRNLEPNDISKNSKLGYVESTKIEPSGTLTITTQLSNSWRLNFEGKRKIHHHTISELYLNNNYVRVNPFLNPEKNWSQLIDLTYNRGQRIDFSLSAFANRTIDLIYLAESNSLGVMSRLMNNQVKPLNWVPTNSDQVITRYGFILSGKLKAPNGAELQFSYQRDLQPTYVPYQAKNRIYIDCKYWLFGILQTELITTIEVDTRDHLQLETTKTVQLPNLVNLIHLKGKMKRNLGQYLTIFIGGAHLSSGSMVMPYYPLRGSYVDLGIELQL